MSRRAAREAAVQIIYEYGFQNENVSELIEYRVSDEFYGMIADELDKERIEGASLDYLTCVVTSAVSLQSQLDELIASCSVGWNINRISRIARAIMYVALTEMRVMDDVDVGVAINEAVEICKKYDSTETVAFINGVLGSIVREGNYNVPRD